MTVRSHLTLLGAALGLATLVAPLPRASLAVAENAPSLLAGNRALAPGFKVRSLAGEALVLDRLRERGPVLLDFWATWCKPCVASLPELEALHRRYRERGLTVIGVSVDGPRNFAKVRPFASRTGLTYPIVLDESGDLQESFRVVAVPTSILIARDGTIARVQQGFRPGESAPLAAAIEVLLGPSDGTAAPADSTGAPDSSGTSAAPR